MSHNEFPEIPRRVSDREFVAFKAWLSDKASQEQSEHVFTERYADVGLNLSYLLEVYEAGVQKKLPESWIPLYKQMKQEESAEYEKYLILHEKYARIRRVSEITIDKAFHPEVDTEPATENTTSKQTSKRRKSSSRLVVKDGKVHKLE